MKITIKITNNKVWTDEYPLELELEDAQKLWVELGKAFTEIKIFKSKFLTMPATSPLYSTYEDPGDAKPD